ncbi:MAG TPA: O-antigen ligase family protein, partial [Candidatus Paceibacterota bacterium]
GSLVALYAVLQWLQLTFGVNVPLVTDETRGRVGSTLGNAAFLAAYLGLTFFATLAVVSEYWHAMRRAPWTAKVLFSGAVLQLLAIFLTATRGGILALVLIGLLITAYLAWRGEGRARTYARGGLAAALFVAALFVGFREQIAQVPIAPLQRIASISLEDVTVSSRLFVWENVGREALKQPITGVGAEHVDILFNRVYDPSAIVEEWFDRSHNAYLDYFVQYGILGFLLYFALVASLVWTSWRLWQKRREQPLGDLKATYGLFILLAVLVYAMQNFFVFDTSMTLWLLLVLLAAAYAASDETTPATPSRITLPRYVSLLAGVVILAFLYPVFIQPLRANLALAEAYIYHVVDIERTTSVLERGLSLNTYADIEYGYQLYSMYTDRQQHMLEGEELITAYEFARDTLTKNYERYPYDARTAVYLAHVFDSAP